MKNAYLYIRVSTLDNESAINQQRQILTKFCSDNNIKIADIFIDVSAIQDFNRPEFQKFLSHIKASNSKNNYLLFYSWDRFSRNISECKKMVNELSLKGINATSIDDFEQLLNTSELN